MTFAVRLSGTRPDIRPAFHTRRRPERDTFGPRIEAVFRALLPQFEPMPWQRSLWNIIGEQLTDRECREQMLPAGTPAYREIVLSVPRRAAKTTSAFAVLVDQMTRQAQWAGRTPRAVYSAQTGTDARKKFLRDFKPMLEGPNASPAIKKRFHRALTANGAEAAMFKSGAGIYLGGNTAAADHGQEWDAAVIDEAFADVDNRREAAISPGQLTLPWAQRIVCSTAGTAESLFWNQKCARGREAAVADSGQGLAMIEYKIPDGASIFDEELWWEYHPALGYSIDLATLRFEIQQLVADEARGGEMEARRAYGNISTVRVFSQHISPADWETLCVEGVTAKGSGPRVWSFDVAEDRSYAAIATHNIETGVTAVTDYLPGVSWVVERLAERLRQDPGGVVYDATGPGANLADGNPGWLGLSAAGNKQAFADFMDLAQGRAGTVRVRRDKVLDAALAAADIRRSSDASQWSRDKSKSDISPLVAVQNATVCRPPAVRKLKPFLV